MVDNIDKNAENIARANAENIVSDIQAKLASGNFNPADIVAQIQNLTYLVAQFPALSAIAMQLANLQTQIESASRSNGDDLTKGMMAYQEGNKIFNVQEELDNANFKIANISANNYLNQDHVKENQEIHSKITERDPSKIQEVTKKDIDKFIENSQKQTVVEMTAEMNFLKIMKQQYQENMSNAQKSVNKEIENLGQDLPAKEMLDKIKEGKQVDEDNQNLDIDAVEKAIESYEINITANKKITLLEEIVAKNTNPSKHNIKQEAVEKLDKELSQKNNNQSKEIEQMATAIDVKESVNKEIENLGQDLSAKEMLTKIKEAKKPENKQVDVKSKFQIEEVGNSEKISPPNTPNNNQAKSKGLEH
jgi:PIN domain nuclease of toxin-antitoxin system